MKSISERNVSTFFWVGLLAICSAGSQAARAEETVTAGEPSAETDAAIDAAYGADTADTAKTIDVADAMETAEADRGFPISLHYLSVFYGPAIGKPSSLISTADGVADPGRPVFLKNFLTAGYKLTDDVEVSGTAYWLWRPVRGQDVSMQDPFVRLSHSRLLSTDRWSLYGDVRAHAAISTASRDNDLLAGFQTFEAVHFELSSRFLLGLYLSGRYNVFGKQGSGDDAEFYLAPNVSYQLTEKVALTVLYEMGASHTFGERPWHFKNDGTDLQPGINWEITPQLLVNPYLNIYTGNKVSWRSTSFGMSVSWNIL